MLTIFWDAKGIISPAGTNMNKEYYSDLIRPLKLELAKKRRNKLQMDMTFSDMEIGRPATHSQLGVLFF